jgi:hypothetical protein
MTKLSLIGAVVALAGVLGSPSLLAATSPQRLETHSAGPSCNLASAKRVKSALGITVGAPLVTRNGPVTVCQFMSKVALLVRFETNETAALFAAGRKSFAQHGVPTKPVSRLGTTAYSSSFAGSNTIVVLQGKTELLITSSDSLAKVEALAKLILPSL